MSTDKQSIHAPVGESGGRGYLALTCLCFVLSGLAALIYQTVWARQFALAFGMSELAIAAVLAAYMGGLALGAWAIEKRIARICRPLLWYVWIEIGIALAALILVPLGQWLSNQLLVAVFGGAAEPPDASLGATSFFYLAAAFLVLLIPTSLMGATLPLLARYAVHSKQQIGRRIGLLYACNTTGAVGGALLGALVLLPGIGLSKTVWTAAAVNVAVACLAFALYLRSSRSAAPPEPENVAAMLPEPERFRPGVAAAWVLPLMLLSGAVSFLHEVLWTRMLSHVLGSSIFAFGVMLASFLAGIALGGGLGAVLARERESAARWLAISELAAAIAAIGAWYVLQSIDPSLESLAGRALFGFGLLFSLAFAIGATYPLAVRVLARDVADAALASARVYSWNTVGAIVGAIAGGFLIVPMLRYEGALRLAVIGSCVLAMLACFTLFRPGRRFGAVVTVCALVPAAAFVPQPPDALLRFSPLQEAGEGELFYYGVGRSSAVVILRLGDLADIRSNGLPEAAIDIRGTSPRSYPESWMAPLAVLARPQLRDMLVVGFGGGRVLEAIPPSVRDIDVIELEQKVIESNRLMSERGLRDPEFDPLRDPRVHVIVNDARGTLQLTTRKYDAIISQPSHPWTAGASHLYTREFMQQAREHLTDGGVFVQWMNVRFLDAALLRSLLATLNAVYPHVRVYRPDSATLLFLASDEPIEPETTPAATRTAIELDGNHYGRVGLNALEDLVASLVLDDRGSQALAADARVVSDDNNRFAVASVYDFGYVNATKELETLLAPYDPLLAADSFIYRELGRELAFDYIARRINTFVDLDAGARARLQGLAARVTDPGLRAYVATLARSDPGAAPPIAGTRDYPGNDLVLRAQGLAAAGDWVAVAALDDVLEGIPWTSPFKGRAVRLRVELRLRLSASPLQPDLDSIRMIDRLVFVERDPQLYLLRARAAGEDPYYLAESLFRYALAILQGLVTTDDVPRQEFAMLQARFAALGPDSGVYSYHLSEIRNALVAAAAMLE